MKTLTPKTMTYYSRNQLMEAMRAVADSRNIKFYYSLECKLVDLFQPFNNGQQFIVINFEQEKSDYTIVYNEILDIFISLTKEYATALGDVTICVME